MFLQHLPVHNMTRQAEYNCYFSLRLVINPNTHCLLVTPRKFNPILVGLIAGQNVLSHLKILFQTCWSLI